MKKLFTLFVLFFCASGILKAQDELPEDCLYTSLGEVIDCEGWKNPQFPYVRDVKIEAYDGYTIIRGWAGVEGYDIAVEFNENDAILGVTPIVNGEMGETVTNGFVTIYTGREDFEYIRAYLASGYGYAGQYTGESGYVILQCYLGEEWTYYYCVWPQSENGPEEWDNPFEGEATYLYSAVAKTGEAGGDWGSTVFPVVENINVDVYDKYIYIHALGGVNGYDAKVAYDENENVLSVLTIENGEEGTPSKTYAYIYTGRDDWYCIQAYNNGYSYAGVGEDKSGYVTLGSYIYNVNETSEWSYYHLSWDSSDVVSGGNNLADVDFTNAEKWVSTTTAQNEEGATIYVAAPGYETLGAEGEASIVKIESASFTGEHVSGPVAGYIDGPLKEDGTLDYKIDNGWDGPKTQPLSADGSIAPLNYMQGKGNPVNLSKIVFEEITTDDVPTGVFRANWDASYYNPDGSTGGPQNGTYLSVTSKVDGTFKVGVWANKGNRDLYVCPNTDYKAMAFGTDVYVQGYVQATNWTEEETTDANLIGQMKPIDIKTKAALAIEADSTATPAEGDYFILAGGNRPVWAWLTFAAQKDVTYYIFNKNTQIGLMDVAFVSAEADAIETVTVARPATNGAVYNLAGQKVGADYKGIVIKNGRKVMVK